MHDSSNPDLNKREAIDRACDAFEKAWQQGSYPEIANFVVEAEASIRADLVYELILLDFDYREKSGKSLNDTEYRERLPDFVDAVNRAVSELKNKFSTVVGNTLDGHEAAAASNRNLGGFLGERVRYFGDYELLAELARGGMGVVYRAKQLSLNRVIALKMILSGNVAGDDEIRRFQREAEAAANLDHPNIVPIYDIGQHNGQHYFSMKLIEGGTLGGISDEIKNDPERAIELMATVSDAVHHAHQRGILHRDLKPANILLDSDGQPLITDFGLAHNTKSDQQLTQTGAIVGTPGFMAPEQAAGKGVTIAADIYSLGAILYYLLCGRPPHKGESVMGTLMSVINESPPKPRELNPQIHPDLELICLKCLAKEPANRYTSASEFAGDLRAFTSGEPLRVRAPSIFELVRKWFSNNFGNVLWIPLIALLIGALAGFSLWACTIGQDLAFYRQMYDMFPAAERSFLAVNWKSLQYPMFVIFVLSLSITGWLTARLTRTKNRTADISAGLAVGLLTGLVAFACGMGTVLVESMLGNVRQDSELMFQIAATGNSVDSYAQQRLATRYPTLQQLSPVERTSALSMKIVADRYAGTFIATAVGTLVCLAWFGVLGTGQLFVAGPLRREFSFWQGMFYYFCFAFALTSGLFVIGTEVTSWTISGSGYILDWPIPIACLLLATLVVLAVVARWPWPALLTTTTLWLVAFGLFLQLFLSAPMPRIAGARTEIKTAQHQVDVEPNRREFQMRLARAHHGFAIVLCEFRMLKHDRRALAEYRAAIAAVEIKPVRDFNSEEAILHSQLLENASFLAMGLGETEEAAKWAAMHLQQYASPPRMLNLYAEAVFASERPVIEFLTPTTDKNVNAWYRLAVQLRALASYKEARAPAEEPRADQWLSRVVEQVLVRTKVTSGDEQWPTTRQLLQQWLTSRQNWELFGPFPIDDSATKMDAIDIAYEPEADLIAGESVLTPNQVISVYTGANIDLLGAFGSGNDDSKSKSVFGYARTTFNLNSPQRIRFRFGSDDGIKVWIDGNLLLRNAVKRSVFEGSDIVSLKEPLPAGLHTLIFKITQGEGDWGFVFNTAQDDDWPLLLDTAPIDSMEP